LVASTVNRSEATMFNLLSPQMHTPQRVASGAIGSASPNAIASLLSPADVLLDLDVHSKQRSMEEIARFIGARHGLPARDVLASLEEREKLGSTALGRGVAIPHARVKGLSAPIAAFVRLTMPIPFDAPDGNPVGDLFVLLVPEQATGAHLQLVAQIAEMFCEMSFRDELRNSVAVPDIHATFTRWKPA
jgi:nitrogen PTS system EIIA component